MSIEYARVATKDGANESCVAYDYDEQVLYNFNGFTTVMDRSQYEGTKVNTVKNARGKWDLSFWSE